MYSNTSAVTDLNGENVYYQTEDSLTRILSEGLDVSSANLHAWLTLPSMEIIDMIFPTSYGVINNKKPSELGGVIIKHASELTGGMSYHPMIIGTEFLEKSIWKR